MIRSFSSVSKPGASKGLVILLVIVVIVAGLFAYKIYQKRETLQDTTQKTEKVAPPKENYQATLPAQATPEVAQPASQPAPRKKTPEESSVSMQATAPGTDKVVSPAFIKDLASFLASSYQPAHSLNNTGNHGITTLSFKQLNMHYGINLTGRTVQKTDPLQGRREVLDHLMSPTVLRIVYDLFSDSFVRELALQGSKQERLFEKKATHVRRKITTNQVREMLRIYGTQVHNIGILFQAFGKNPALIPAFDAYYAAVRRVNTAYALYADKDAQNADQQQLDELALEIKDAIQQREEKKETVLTLLDAENNVHLGHEEELEIAQWAYRRIKQDAEATKSIATLASLAKELTLKMTQYVYPPAK